MLDPKLLYNNLEWIAKKLARRNFLLDIDELNKNNNFRKVLQKKIEKLYIEKKTLAKIINKAQNKNKNIDFLHKQAHLINDQLISLKLEMQLLKKKIMHYHFSLPNIPDDHIPSGFKDENNVEILRWGKLHYHNFKPMDHITLGKLIGGIDLSSASKITGSRFIVLNGMIARLHRALSQFMIDLHIKNHGYKEYYLPYLVNTESLFGSGQLPKFYKDLFHIQSMNITDSIVDVSFKNEYTLIPTAEVPLINLMRDIIIDEQDLPIKMVAHTPCFRLEAGTYGRRTHGLIRAHQFDKVELVQIVNPHRSNQALEEITSHSEKVLQLLNLPYRKILLSAGNISFASCKTYDLEVWLPSNQVYCEISSCSNVRDFQSRRIRARFRDKTHKKLQLLHTLNASGVAVGRALVAILENYQSKDRCIQVPSVLNPYMDGTTHIYY